MNKDTKCPYCGEWQEINHDDGYGYDEDKLHEQECNNCQKTFTFRTSIIFSYESMKADCLNGSNHNFQPTYTHPIEFSTMRCADCEEERKLTDKEWIDLYKERGIDVDRDLCLICVDKDICNSPHAIFGEHDNVIGCFSYLKNKNK